jgi:hypothetical protein
MGREARRVPANWQHPKDAAGDYIPLYDGAVFAEQVARWDEGARKWTEGFRDDFKGGWVALNGKEKALSYAARHGTRPNPENYMPLWRDEERTHIMMYNDTTPISPVFATAHELAQWLSKTNASWFGGKGASYEAWMSIIENSANSLPIFS